MTTSFPLGYLLAGAGPEQLLVPEIQRDYVWKPPQLDQLLDSLRVTYAKSQRSLDLHVSGTDADAALTRAVVREHCLRHHSHQLGFLYAYHDQAYGSKAFLIDGQQRLLTLYLLLLAQAVRENEQPHFAAHYMLPGGSLRLDYRVREATQEFLPRFVRFVLATPGLAAGEVAAAVRGQYWFFRAYEADETITRVLANYDYLAARPDNPSYDFLQHHVRFWFFDTGDSARGEDLYLSLNSTGLLTSPGENERARLLEPVTDAAAKRQWGQRLEQWQSFFWKHRVSTTPANANADAGYNEFFRWVRVLGPVVAALPTAQVSARQALLAPGLAAPDALPPAASLATAERLMAVLALLFPLPGAVANPLAAGLEAAWLAPGPEGLKPGQAFQLLPVLAYCLGRAQVPDLDHPATPGTPATPGYPAPAARWQHLPRVIRYFQNLRRLPGLAQAGRDELASRSAEALLLAYELGRSATGDIAQLPQWAGHRALHKALLPPEEAAKLRLYARLPAAERTEAEALLWALEDEEYNGGEIAHLCADAPPDHPFDHYDLAAVRCLSRRYQALELSTPAGRAALQTLFLYLGDCTCEDNVSYLYEQYNYGNWARILRNAGQVFRPFFQGFLLDETLTVAALHAQARRAHFGARPVAEHLADSSFDNQLRVLALVFEQLQRHPPPGGYAGGAVPTLWGKGSELGCFYREHAPGRDASIAPEQEALFGAEHTRRFWNARYRLTSAWHTRRALLPLAYDLFRQQPPVSYRDFVAACLAAAGAPTATRPVV